MLAADDPYAQQARVPGGVTVINKRSRGTLSREW